MNKILLLIAIIPFVFISCDDDKDEPKSTININEKNVVLNVGDEYQFTVTGNNPLDYKYHWESYDMIKILPLLIKKDY